jgi:hypothetical protein
MARWGEGGYVVASPACSEGREFSHGYDAAQKLRCGKSRPVALPMARRVAELTYPRSIRKQCPHGATLMGADRSFPARGSGFGLALDRGDLIFVAVFGAACGMAILGGMQRFP